MTAMTTTTKPTIGTRFYVSTETGDRLDAEAITVDLVAL